MEMTHFGNRLKEIVKEKWGTQTIAAEALGITQSTLSKWLRLTVLAQKQLEALAVIEDHGYNVGYLFDPKADKYLTATTKRAHTKKTSVKVLTEKVRETLAELVTAEDGSVRKKYYFDRVNTLLDEVEKV